MLVLASCGKHTTWHRFCVLRPSVLKCPTLSRISLFSRISPDLQGAGFTRHKNSSWALTKRLLQAIFG